MSKVRPKLTTLPIDDIKALLVALHGDVDPLNLLCVNHIELVPGGDVLSVHSHCLAWFLVSRTIEASTNYARCCERLIELGAPLTDIHGAGASIHFSSLPWWDNDESAVLTAHLADAYAAAGLWDVNQRLKGLPMSRQKSPETTGYTCSKGVVPLAAALLDKNPRLAEYLISRGAHLDLGEVYAGEAMHAVDLALETGEARIHSMVAAALMGTCLSASAPASTHLSSPVRDSMHATTPRRVRRAGI